MNFEIQSLFYICTSKHHKKSSHILKDFNSWKLSSKRLNDSTKWVKVSKLVRNEMKWSISSNYFWNSWWLFKMNRYLNICSCIHVTYYNEYAFKCDSLFQYTSESGGGCELPGLWRVDPPPRSCPLGAGGDLQTTGGAHVWHAAQE